MNVIALIKRIRLVLRRSFCCDHVQTSRYFYVVRYAVIMSKGRDIFTAYPTFFIQEVHVEFCSLMKNWRKQWNTRKKYIWKHTCLLTPGDPHSWTLSSNVPEAALLDSNSWRPCRQALSRKRVRMRVIAEPPREVDVENRNYTTTTRFWTAWCRGGRKKIDIKHSMAVYRLCTIRRLRFLKILACLECELQKLKKKDMYAKPASTKGVYSCFLTCAATSSCPLEGT